MLPLCYLINFAKTAQAAPSGTGRQYNIRLMLDMRSDKRCILRMKIGLASVFDANLTLT